MIFEMQTPLESQLFGIPLWELVIVAAILYLMIELLSRYSCYDDAAAVWGFIFVLIAVPAYAMYLIISSAFPGAGIPITAIIIAISVITSIAFWLSLMTLHEALYPNWFDEFEY